jgi:hypothetical protein
MVSSAPSMVPDIQVALDAKNLAIAKISGTPTRLLSSNVVRIETGPNGTVTGQVPLTAMARKPLGAARSAIVPWLNARIEFTADMMAVPSCAFTATAGPRICLIHYFGWKIIFHIRQPPLSWQSWFIPSASKRPLLSHPNTLRIRLSRDLTPSEE